MSTPYYLLKHERARRMRSAPTAAEAALWGRLKGCALDGYRFIRQQPLGGYIVDFYCAEVRLAVEVDGGYHCTPEQARRDADRDSALSDRGVRTLRFTNSAVLNNIDAVAFRIGYVCGQFEGRWLR